MSEPSRGTARVEAFSDGVFAVAITLLVLDLHVGTANGHLAKELANEWPHYATYAVSFLTVGIIWMNHHAQWERIQRVDRTMMTLNLVLLMTIVLIPFPTSLLATNLHAPSDQHVAAAVYSGTLLAMGLAFFATHVWAIHAGLLDRLTPRNARLLLLRNGAGECVYLVAIGVAFVNATISLVLCGLVALYYLHPGKPLDE